jgi:hypothetical protein
MPNPTKRRQKHNFDHYYEAKVSIVTVINFHQYQRTNNPLSKRNPPPQKKIQAHMLATHYRVIVSNDQTAMGLPKCEEVKIRIQAES